MQQPKRSAEPPRNADMESRRYPRSRVLKAVTIYPVVHEIGFPISNISQFGVMGRCALPLSLRQDVHLTFDGQTYLAAEVRWAQGDRYGLQLAGAWHGLPGGDRAADGFDESVILSALRGRAPRIPADIPATLVTTRPMLSGRIRNISCGGAMIDVGVRLREAERLLIRMRDQPTVIGRIQWAKDGCIGLEFSQELSTEIGLTRTMASGREAGDEPDGSDMGD